MRMNLKPLFLLLLYAGATLAADPLTYPQDEHSWVRALAIPQFKGANPCAKGIYIADDLKKICRPRAGAHVLFEVDSSRIRDRFTPALDGLGQALRGGLRDAILVIQGHTDSSGPEAHNLLLSIERAQSVRAYLVDRFGIDPERLRFEGYGEGEPRADNNSAGGRRQNRRVEIVRIGTYGQ